MTAATLVDQIAARLGVARRSREPLAVWHARILAAVPDAPSGDPEWLRLARGAERGAADCITTWIVHLDGRSAAARELVRLGLAQVSNTGPYHKSNPAPWIGVANGEIGRALVAALPASARAYLGAHTS